MHELNITTRKTCMQEKLAIKHSEIETKCKFDVFMLVVQIATMAKIAHIDPVQGSHRLNIRS